MGTRVVIQAVSEDLNRYLLILAGGIGLALFSGTLAYLVASRLVMRRKKLISNQMRAEALEYLGKTPQEGRFMEKMPDWANAWIYHTQKRMDGAGLKIPIGRYVAGLMLAGTVGVIVAAVMFNNLPAAVVLVASAFLVPDVFLSAKIQAEKNKMVEQMGVAVRIFASEFSETPQVAVALTRTAESIPAPLKIVFQRAVNDLSSGYDKNKVFSDLMEKLDFEYGRMFVQLMRIAWEDASVKPLFSRLAVRVASLHVLEAENRKQTAISRWMALAINLSVIPMFFISRILIPGAGEFLTQNPFGKLLVFVSFLSVLVGLLMDRTLTNVDP